MYNTIDLKMIFYNIKNIEYIKVYVVRKEVTDVEKILEIIGIEVYAKYICGYHIHGRAATSVDASIHLLKSSYVR